VALEVSLRGQGKNAEPWHLSGGFARQSPCIDPSAARKAKKKAKAQTGDTFEAIAREWFERFSVNWAPGYSVKIEGRLEKDVYPWVGQTPILKLEAPDLLMVLRRIEARGAVDSAHRVRTTMGQIFRYAIATGRAKRDPAADLKGAIPPARSKHLAAVTQPEMVAGLLRAIDGYSGHFATKCETLSALPLPDMGVPGGWLSLSLRETSKGPFCEGQGRARPFLLSRLSPSCQA
jgi:hypothetical protein